jgi:hypothetical protein
MLCLLLACASIPALLADAPPLELVASIALPGVEGRIDHLALDEARSRLHVAARDHGTLEVVDLAAKKHAGRVEGLGEPQGVVFLEARNELWVSQGSGGVLDAYRGDTLERLERLKLGPDGDNLRYDEARGQLWLAYASGALASIDVATRKALGRARLPGHPEAFALERQGRRIFANVPAERGVFVVDREKHEQVAFWPIASAQANYPLLLLEGGKQLLVGCRNPGKLVVFDLDSGKELQALELSGDVDDLWHDEARGRIYASCGEGKLDVFAREEQKPEWKRVRVLDSAKGARTSCFSAARKQLFLAVPKSEEHPAEIRIYATRD